MAGEEKNSRLQSDPEGREHRGSGRDPEERPLKDGGDRKEQARERALDKTIADSFPTSDPPSTIPDPAEEEGAA